MRRETSTDNKTHANNDKSRQDGVQDGNTAYREAVTVQHAYSMELQELRLRLNALGVDVDSMKACTRLKYPRAYSKRVASLLPAVHKYLAELTGGRAKNGNVLTDWY